MNNFNVNLGIEVHVVINTKSKMFSFCKSFHQDQPNTNIDKIVLAMPGTLPNVNKCAVQKAICLAKKLKMQISQVLVFDRKNYFYFDLPKGYQITQKFFPLATNGYLEIFTEDHKTKQIKIKEMHLEEDTAKQNFIGDKILLDYNRCGMPLIEIVSDCNLSSSYEVIAYLTKLKQILNFGEISDAKMEEGSLRADINLSINLFGQTKLGSRVEIKNLNSFANIKKAIDYEINTHISANLQNIPIVQATKKWDEKLNKTIFMRKKEDEVKYHYIPEPNILPIKLTKEFIDHANAKYDIEEVKNDLLKNNVNEKIIDLLLNDYELFKIFSYVAKKIKNYQLAITWILIELVGLLKKDNQAINQFPINKIDQIIIMLEMLIKNEINSKQCKTIISQIYTTNHSTKEIIVKFNFKQITDPKILLTLINEILLSLPNIAKQYDTNPDKVEKIIIGQLMAKTKGQANPNIAIKIVKDLLTQKK